MNLCPYCSQRISFFGTFFGGINHTKCNADAKKHKNYLRRYIKQEALLGRFDRRAPEEFFSAEKYLSLDEIEAQFAAGYDDAVEEMCDDLVLDDNELKNLEDFIGEFARIYKPSSYEHMMKMLNRFDTSRTLHQARTLYKLNQGKLIQRKPPIGLFLNKNETFIYSWASVKCSTLNVKTKYKGRSTGGSYRISKNFSIRHTEHRGRPINYTEWTDKGYGVMAVTNKHLFFLGDGDKGDVKERFSSISSIDPTSDGFIINLTLKTRPAVRFTLSGTSRDAWFASNIIMMAPSL
jgi:hypothetical protein